MRNGNCYDSLERCKEYYLDFQPKELSVCLKDIFETLVKNAQIRDQWTFTWTSTSNCVELQAVSVKQKHEYTLRLFGGKIYIESDLFSPQYIKYVSSEFWAILSELDLIEGFMFRSNADISDIGSFDTKVGRSSTYQIVRNFVLLEEHKPDSTIDLGCLEVSWDLSKTVQEIQESCVGAIKGIHRLNYLLYRLQYQSLKRQKA
ncbi:hypothetical protein ACSTD9_22340 [Vibrio vulnificus]|uniref:hypothetical protein n=1 Tax=Vibrio vulnificus TaxID=672 RepID=UPI003772105A|nr:hypothetical protein [Vibrio cholerae]